MLDEFQGFMATLQDKSKATQRSYVNSYQKLHELLGRNIRDCSEDRILKVIDENVTNVNSQATLINVSLLVRRLFNYSTVELVKRRAKNKETIQVETKMRNTLSELPSLDTYDKYIADLYEAGKYQHFIINYLIRNCYVRNADLEITFLDAKKLCDKNSNCIWVTPNSPRVVYYRNVYKTANTYGSKENEINDKQLYKAIQKFREISGDTLLRITPCHEIRKATLNSLGEGAMLKIIVTHFKGDINTLKEISESRGTSLYTLLTSYNLDFNVKDI